MVPLIDGVNQGEPRLREQAIRILGRDCRENGRVEYEKPEARLPPPALKHLDALIAMADDPDAGVRRELILAFRNLPTDKVGDALRKLAAAWDGQDRWYLEALGLALEKRESAYLAKLFDGTLYGELDLDQAGKKASSRFRRISRSIVTRPISRPVRLTCRPTPSARYLGLAWRIHRREVLPVLEHIMPYLRSPDLQQAADDILERMSEPETAELVADMAMKKDDPVHRRELFALLARRLAGEWNPAATRPKVLEDDRPGPGRPRDASARDRAGGRDAGRTVSGHARRPRPGCQGTRRRASRRRGGDRLVQDHAQPGARATGLVGAGQAELEFGGRGGRAGHGPALRALGGESTDLLTARDYPLGLRRQALRSIAQLRDGGSHVIELARSGKLPEDLKTEAATILYTSPDRRLREQASTVLPLPKTAAGRPLPSIFELIRSEGHAENGRDVFFRAAPIRAGAATACRGTVSGSGRTCRRSGSSTARKS